MTERLMYHRTQDTYSLTDFREKTGEHLERIKAGVIETITQNGQATLVLMSPERYDALVDELERGHIWDKALTRIKAGERGIDSEELVRSLVAELAPAP